jgi:hypothetical protein
MNTSFLNLLSITMVLIGLMLLLFVWRPKKDKSCTLAKITAMDGKIDEISEVERRLKLLNEDFLEPIALSMHINTEKVFKPDYIDPIIEMMVKKGLMESAYMDDSMIAIGDELRKILMHKYGHTHMRNLIKFAHAIDENGKLVISADTVNFLTTEYDPVLLNPENIKQKVSV